MSEGHVKTRCSSPNTPRSLGSAASVGALSRLDGREDLFAWVYSLAHTQRVRLLWPPQKFPSWGKTSSPAAELAWPRGHHQEPGTDGDREGSGSLGLKKGEGFLDRSSVEIRKKMVLSPKRKENKALISNISQIREFNYLAFEQTERKLRAKKSVLQVPAG